MFGHGAKLRNFIGLIVAFGLIIRFIYGILYIKLWAFLILATALVVVLIISLRRNSNFGRIGSAVRRSDEPAPD